MRQRASDDSPLSLLAQRYLREIASAPSVRRDKFDGRALWAMWRRGLVEWPSAVTVAVTERGRKLARDLAVPPAPDVEPTLRETIEVLPERRPTRLSPGIDVPPADGMAELCCDSFEGAVAAGALRIAPSSGAVYFFSPGGSFWPISFCPHCGAKKVGVRGDDMGV